MEDYYDLKLHEIPPERIKRNSFNVPLFFLLSGPDGPPGEGLPEQHEDHLRRGQAPRDVARVRTAPGRIRAPPALHHPALGNNALFRRKLVKKHVAIITVRFVLKEELAFWAHLKLSIWLTILVLRVLRGLVTKY